MEATGMRRFGGAGRAALDCNVMEEDWQRGQSYTAYWSSPNLLPQLKRPAMTEAERSEKCCEARRLLQRFLSGAISQRLSESKTYPTGPHQPNAGSSALMPVRIQKEKCCTTLSPNSIVLETRERKTMVKMTKLPRFLG